MKKFPIALIFTALSLASCGAPKNEITTNSGNNTASVAENKTSETSKPAANENPEANLLNACLVLPKADVEKILGQSVNSANLSRQVGGTAETAALSMCTYQTAGGQTIEFFARRSPVADNTHEAIQQVRDTMKKVTQKDVEKISDLGKEAFWVSVVNQLHVFQGENVYFYVTMRNFKDAGEAKAKSIELARQAEKALSPQQK